ncbi:MAG: ATPase V [Bacteroidales bacterium]|nr:ATPase V [Bacteroidales bacterium]
MIVKMTKYSILLLTGNKESALEKIQKIGLMDITRSAKPIDKTSEAMLEGIASSRRTMEVLSSIDLSREEDYNEIEKTARSLRKDTRDPRICLAEAQESLREMTERLDQADYEMEAARHWGEFSSKKLELLKDEGINLHFYTVPVKKFSADWTEHWPMSVISTDDDTVWFVVAGEFDDIPAEEVSKPERSYAELTKEVWNLQQGILVNKAKMEALKERREEVEKLYSDQIAELNLYLANASGESVAEDRICLLTGFAPTENDETVCEALDQMDLYYMKAPAEKEDNPPIKLRNNWFARNFETLTGMYGMPVYDEFDPTPILAPFFLLFWAFCLGDAGYGLILILLGLLLRNRINVLGLRKHWRLVVTLGVGSFFVGLILGTFFGINLAELEGTPQWLKSIMVAGKTEIGGAAYDTSMIAAIAVGVFHICLAMVIKAVGLTRRFGIKSAISAWGWVVLIVGGLLVAAGALTSVLDADATRIAVIVIGVISVLSIYIFNKPGRNPLVNIGAGLWDTYGMATGLLGDVLSYIRLYALGLAGGMLGGAFNNLAGMTLGPNPTWQWVFWLLIVLLGHALNFAMSCLGAFVHPLRLTFVEYFKNSGYEGKGTKFNPLKK